MAENKTDAAFEAWMDDACPGWRAPSYHGGTHWHLQREAFRAGAAAGIRSAGEPDLGDGTAAPEETFWDDRTTPGAYSQGDSARDLAGRRAYRERLREIVAEEVLGGPGEHHCIENGGCTVCAGNRAVDVLMAAGYLVDGKSAQRIRIDALQEARSIIGRRTGTYEADIDLLERIAELEAEAN